MFLKAPTPAHRRKLMLAYQDLYILPYNWTILHILAITKPKAIPLIATYPEFKVPFMRDIYGKTPLHYILASKQINYVAANAMLNYIVDYIRDDTHCSSFRNQTILASMTPLFLFNITKTSPDVAQKYLDACFQEAPTRYGEYYAEFGREETSRVFSKVPVLLPQAQKELIKSGDQQISVRTIMLDLDYDSISEDMKRTASTLSRINSEEILGTPVIMNILDYLWEQSQPTLKVLGVLYSILMVMLSVYIGVGKTMRPVEVSILITAFIFLLSELTQLWSMKRDYFQSLWNYIDFSNNVLIIAYAIMKLMDYNDPTLNAWISAVIILLGYTRWISYLRLFDSTSKYLFIAEF